MANEGPMTTEHEPTTNFERAQASEPFQRLRATQRSFVFPLGIAFLLWYFASVLLADYAHEFRSTPVFGNINVGLLWGLAQFVTTFSITTWYVSHANRKVYSLADEIRHDLAEGDSTDAGTTSGSGEQS